MLDVAAASPVVAEAPHTRRLYVFRCVFLGWIVACGIARQLVPWLGAPLDDRPGFDLAVELIWTAFAAIQVGLLVGFRREVGGHPAVALVRAAFALAVVDLAASVLFLVLERWGHSLMSVLGLDSTPASVFFLLLSFAFDVVLWVALERLLGGVEAPLRAAFYGLRAASLALNALFLLPFETYRALLTAPAFRLVSPWLHIALSASWNLTVVVALHRLSRRAPAAAATLAPTTRPSGTYDLLVGGAWLGGGLLVTLVTYSAASSGGGRYFVATGAIAYGAVRMVRGFARLGSN